RIVIADGIGVAKVGLHGHVVGEIVRHEPAETGFVERDVSQHYGLRTDGPGAILQAGSSTHPEIAVGGLELPIDRERKLRSGGGREPPVENCSDAIPQLWIASGSRMEIVLLIVGTNEALGDEAIAENLITDRAVAAEHIAVAVWGGRHGKVEADADEICPEETAGKVKIA